MEKPDLCHYLHPRTVVLAIVLTVKATLNTSMMTMMMVLMVLMVMLLTAAVCHRGCANGGECVEPEECRCVDPYVGVTCRENKQGICCTLQLFIVKIRRPARRKVMAACRRVDGLKSFAGCLPVYRNLLRGPIAPPLLRQFLFRFKFYLFHKRQTSFPPQTLFRLQD